MLSRHAIMNKNNENNIRIYSVQAVLEVLSYTSFSFNAEAGNKSFLLCCGKPKSMEVMSLSQC